MFNYTVKVYPIKNPRSKLRAYASLIVDDQLEITGFKVFESAKGLFAKEPQHKGTNKDGEETWYDDVRFLRQNEEEANPLRQEVMDAIISAYNQSANSGYNSSPTQSRTSAAQAQAQVNQDSAADRFPW